MMYGKSVLALIALEATATEMVAASRYHRRNEKRSNLRKLLHSTPADEAVPALVAIHDTTPPATTASHTGSMSKEALEDATPCEATEPICRHKAVGNGLIKLKTDYFCEGKSISDRGGWAMTTGDCFDLCAEICPTDTDCERTVDDSGADANEGWCIPVGVDVGSIEADDYAASGPGGSASMGMSSGSGPKKGASMSLSADDEEAAALTDCVQKAVCFVNSDGSKYKTEHACESEQPTNHGVWTYLGDYDCPSMCADVCDGLDCVPDESDEKGVGKCVDATLAKSAGGVPTKKSMSMSAESADEAIAGSECEEVAICLKKTDSYKFKTEYTCAGVPFVAKGNSPWRYLGDGECSELCEGTIVCPDGTECLEEVDEDTGLLTGAVVCGATSSLSGSGASADEPCDEKAYCLRKDNTKYKTKYMCEGKVNGNGPWEIYMEGDCCDLDVCSGKCVSKEEGEVECIAGSIAVAPGATTPSAGATTPFAGATTESTGATTESAGAITEFKHMSANGNAYNKGRKCCSCHCSKGKLHDRCSDDDETSCMEHGTEFSAFHGTCQKNIDAADHMMMLEMCGESDPMCQCEIKKMIVDNVDGGDMFDCKCDCPAAPVRSENSNKGNGNNGNGNKGYGNQK